MNIVEAQDEEEVPTKSDSVYAYEVEQVEGLQQSPVDDLDQTFEDQQLDQFDPEFLAEEDEQVDTF